MYWLFQEGGEWCVCEAGRLETRKGTGFPAHTSAAWVLDQVRAAAPGAAFVLFEDE